MINFPVFQSLSVDGFGLYPGTVDRPGLHIDFESGLTLILGANGLGKSTLIQIMYRLLSGPSEISGLASATRVGDMDTGASKLSGTKRAVFASRDARGARFATATLHLTIGERSVVISRRLSDLALTHFETDGVGRDVGEEGFQVELLTLIGLGNFGDMILLLRHLIFYFEDRRSLIWDPTAQRHLLRLLFLPAHSAAEWLSQERGILELDSHMRNLRNALGKEEQIASQHASREAGSGDVKAELSTLEEIQAHDTDRRESLDAELAELETSRQALRLRNLQLEQENDSRQREFERAKLAVIRSRFPSSSDTAAFILSRILCDAHCLVCGHEAPDAALQQYQERLASLCCVVCGTDLSAQEQLALGAEFADRQLDTIAAHIENTKDQVTASRASLQDTEKAFNLCLSELAKVDTDLADRSLRIDRLVRLLPPEESERREQLTELSRMKRRVQQLKDELAEKRRTFKSFVENENRRINEFSARIKEAFLLHASGFLLEECTLTWSPYLSSVGQGGEQMSLPAFGLELTGGNFTAATRRSGPDEVSESQREFIDLAFRMALMSTAASATEGTSLIIDAPESSLDEVFANRAAEVLTTFANATVGNRLIITSNLIKGDLIPKLIQLGIPSELVSEKVVNLLDIAAPTAAVRALREEYDALYQHVLAEANHV